MNEVEFDKLPLVYETIAEMLGVDAMIALCKRFGGEQLYFPKFDAVQRPIRNAKILSEFNGYNFKGLAKKYNLTEMAVRNICRGEIKTERSKPIEGQVSLFE